jgi:hypothetical protein
MLHPRCWCHTKCNTASKYSDFWHQNTVIFVGLLHGSLFVAVFCCRIWMRTDVNTAIEYSDTVLYNSRLLPPNAGIMTGGHLSDKNYSNSHHLSHAINEQSSCLLRDMTSARLELQIVNLGENEN